MCTAITYKTKDFYFGRTLDHNCSYREEVVIMPRNYVFSFKEQSDLKNHYAIIGMAYVTNNYPLYYEAANEKGLAIAGLNFVGNAVYHEKMSGKDNICQFELIPWILSKCATVEEAKKLLKKINILNDSFNDQLPAAKLHWLIADELEAITVESLKDGLKIYDNKVGVLTNNPPFDYQLFNLNNYLSLTNKQPKNTFSNKLDLKTDSLGMGSLGLPGDLSSQSRFVRATFVKMNSQSKTDELSSISQFFHILNSVFQVRGTSLIKPGEYEMTQYSSCINVTKGIYYYTTYDNQQINAVFLFKENLDSFNLIKYPLIKKVKINYQN